MNKDLEILLQTLMIRGLISFLQNRPLIINPRILEYAEQLKPNDYFHIYCDGRIVIHSTEYSDNPCEFIVDSTTQMFKYLWTLWNITARNKIKIKHLNHEDFKCVPITTTLNYAIYALDTLSQFTFNRIFRYVLEDKKDPHFCVTDVNGTVELVNSKFKDLDTQKFLMGSVGNLKFGYKTKPNSDILLEVSIQYHSGDILHTFSSESFKISDFRSEMETRKLIERLQVFGKHTEKELLDFLRDLIVYHTNKFLTNTCHMANNP